MAPGRIDRDWIANHASTVLAMHIKGSDFSRLDRKLVDKQTGRAIGLTYSDVTYKRTKRHPDRKARRTWWVDGHADEIATLDEALEILALDHAAALSAADAALADQPAGSGSRPDATPLPTSDVSTVPPAGASPRKPETVTP